MIKKKLLLVEDDPFLSSLLKTRLLNEGFDVSYAADGEEALTMAKKVVPDLILLDLILPKKSGFEVMEVLQSDPQLSLIPIMIVSQLGQDQDMKKGKDLGAVAYMVKAKISLEKLVEEAKTFLDQKESALAK